MSQVTDRVDNYIQTWEKEATQIKYYGVFANGKLIAAGRLRVYRKPGVAKNALLRALGFHKPYYSLIIPDKNKEIKEYVEDLLKRGVIEIKQL